MKYSTHSTYINTNREEVPSVTTILKILSKPALSKWANILGFKRQKIEDVLERSSIIGTLTHQVIYAYLMNSLYIWTGTQEGKYIIMHYLNSFMDWKAKHEVSPIFMEKKMISDRFGGTVDFYGMVDGKHTILDFKTSKRVYSSMFLQLAAYIIMLEEAGYTVEQAGIIIVNENKHAEKIINREQFDPYIKVFRTLVELFHGWYDLNHQDGWGNILGK